MGLTITLRDKDDLSYYKDLIIQLFLACVPDEIVICSGYFQEEHPYSSLGHQGDYLVSRDKGYNLNSLIELFAKYKPKVTIVGYRDKKPVNAPPNWWRSSLWGKQYVNFCENVKSKMPPNKVKSYRYISGEWHAKEIFMLKNGSVDVGIIGSSNLTRPAYGDARSNTPGRTGYTMEADTYLYEDYLDKKINPVIKQFQIEDGDDVRVISLPFSSSLNGNKSPRMILNNMYQELMGMLDPNEGLFEEI